MLGFIDSVCLFVHGSLSTTMIQYGVHIVGINGRWRMVKYLVILSVLLKDYWSLIMVEIALDIYGLRCYCHYINAMY